MKNLIYLLLLLLLTSTVYPQLYNGKRSTIPNAGYIPPANPISLPDSLPVVSTIRGDTIAITTYDYFGHDIIRDQVTMVGNLPQFACVIRGFNQSDPSLSSIRHIYRRNGYYVQDAPFGEETDITGPQIDAFDTDTETSTVFTGENPNRMVIFDGTGYSPVRGFSPGSGGAAVNTGSTIFLGSTGNDTEYQFYSTQDNGVTFNNWGSISNYNPPNLYWQSNGSKVIGLTRSPNGQHIVYWGTSHNAPPDQEAHVFDGVPPDSADQVWMVYSHDAGATWTAERLISDGEEVLDGYPYPNCVHLVENFSQVDIAVNDEGIIHIVANGYGVQLNSAMDSVIQEIYPVIYTNSERSDWIALSPPELDTLQILGDLYPGNCIGQSYPGIGVYHYSSYVVITFTGPQLTANSIDTANGVFYRDIYMAYSFNGGETFGMENQFANDNPSISESYAHPVTNGFHNDGMGIYWVPVLYLADPTPTVSLFEPADISEAALVYKYVFITLDDSFMNVEDDFIELEKFSLEQNYPNPFNPSTTIEFTIGTESHINLTVYDMQGEKVAELVNDNRSAGAYNLSFDGSQLASGIYLYRLTITPLSSSSKTKVLSKKMILLK